MILVTGAAGTIGSRLVQRLVERGCSVRALLLPRDPLAERLNGIQCEVCEGDIRRPETLQHALEGIRTVYHLAAVLLSEDPLAFNAVNVEGTRNLIDASGAAGVEHFIYVSSASVIYPRSTLYSRSKQQAEQIVCSQTRMKYTLVRPTLVYEKGGGQEFLIFVNYLKRFPIVPLIGDGQARKNPVHVDDLIAGLASIPGNAQTYGKIYNLCGGEEITMRELAQLLLAHHGLHKRLVPIPVSLCRLAAAVMGAVMKRPLLTQHTIAGLTQDANLDRSTAERDLGYHPVGIREGINRC